jgi:hypothetical protein
MADEQAGEPLPSKPKRRTAPRRAKPVAPPPAPIEPDVIEAWTQSGGAAPVVIEDGASFGADQVTVHQGAVGRVDATQVSVEQGAIGAARADHLRVERGAVGAALGEQVELSRSYARTIIARQVQVDRAAARVVIAADVRTNQSAVMLLIARKVGGDVKVLLDWRGALAFGAAAGLVLALLGRRRSKKA